MPTRFYYGPIDDGMADLGAGIGRGIEGGTHGFLDERDRRRQRRRDDERDAMEKELHELGLYESGYRRGTAPVEEESVVARGHRPTQTPEFGSLFGRPDQMVDPTTGELVDPREAPNELNEALTSRFRTESQRVRDAASGRGPRPAEVGPVGSSLFSRDPVSFEQIPDERLRIQRRMPGYEQVTEGIYRDDNFVAREREAAAAEARAGRAPGAAPDEGLDTDEIAKALMTLYPDMTQEEAEGHATLMGTGASIYGDALDLFPEDEEESATPERGTPEWYDMLEEEAAARRRGAPPASASPASRAPMTFSQADEYLVDTYAIRDQYGEIVGSYLTPGERYEYAVQMSSPGAGVLDLPTPAELHERQFGSPAGAPPPEETRGGGIRDFFGGIGRRLIGEESALGRGIRGALGRDGQPGAAAEPEEPEDVEPADTGTFIDQRVVDDGRQLVDEFPGFQRDELEDVLRDSGFTEEEIDAILEGR